MRPAGVERSLQWFRADLGVGNVGGYGDVDWLCKHVTRTKGVINLTSAPALIWGTTCAAAMDGSLRIACVALIPRAMSWNTLD